jgi:hypothetical protein
VASGWRRLQYHGQFVEVPATDDWRVQIVLDPCHSDRRFYLLIEERATGDRFRLDLGDRQLTIHSDDPDRHAATRDHILNSITGTHAAPPLALTQGPLPTSEACSEAEEPVPTLFPEEG